MRGGDSLDAWDLSMLKPATGMKIQFWGHKTVDIVLRRKTFTAFTLNFIFLKKNIIWNF
jgi:hypothetical protein